MLVAQIRDRFADGSGAFFDTAADADVLIKRPQDPTDNASPSGQSLTLSAFVTLAALTGAPEDQDAADALLARLAGLANARMAQALRLIHEDVARRWTIEDLAGKDFDDGGHPGPF